MSLHSILVVDDEPDSLVVMRRVLEPLGYAVSTAADGREAISLLEHETVDLVITDILMPEVDGFEVIVAVHRNYPNTRTIAVSGGGRLDADLYLTIARGFRTDGVLQKPITRDELIREIKAVEARTSSHN